MSNRATGEERRKLGTWQVRAFIDTLKPLWLEGRMAIMTFSATTSAQDQDCRQESTVLGLCTCVMPRGALVEAPGRTDQFTFSAGGIACGFSMATGNPDDPGRAAISDEARRPAATAKLAMAEQLVN